MPITFINVLECAGIWAESWERRHQDVGAIPLQAASRKITRATPPLAVMTAEVIEKRGGFVLPPELWKQLKPTVDPTVLSSGLLYAPPMPNAALTGA